MKTRILFIGLFLMFSSCSNNEYKDIALKHLKDNYEIDWEGGHVIYEEDEHIFYQEGETPKLEQLNFPILESKLGYQFFETTLKTAHLEVPQTIIRIVVNKDKKEVKILDTINEYSLPNFVKLFYGLKLNTESEKLEASKEIATLLHLYVYKFEEMEFQKKGEGNLEEFIYKGKYDILTFKYKENKLFEFDLFNPITQESEIKKKANTQSSIHSK